MLGEPRDVKASVRYLIIALVVIVLIAVGAWAWQHYRYRSVSIGGETNVNVEAVPTVDPIVLAAGDIATCGIKGSSETAAVLERTKGTILALGDEVYQSGSTKQFNECYAPTWGKFLDRTRPVPGNHEYQTTDAADYYAYFGAAAGDPLKGYYSFDLGAWHIVALNSNCDHVGGCGATSPMTTWLRADLAAHPTTCTLAYWHVPRFSSGMHGSTDTMQTLWQTAVDGGVDVVLNGHDHVYERFAPTNANGDKNEPNGAREFIVGTGGTSHYNFVHVLPTSEARDNTSYGVLKLVLHATGYNWEFLPVDGGTFRDVGTGACH